MNKKTTAGMPRYPIFSISPYSTNITHPRNPWVIAWWSAAFPGFGHLLLGNYIIGFILILWEIFINLQTNVNLGILYSFTGRSDLAKEILDKRELLLYLAVYVFAIWDSFCRTVDANKLYRLSQGESPVIEPVSMCFVEINMLDKKNPWLCSFWSLLMPGLGYIHIHKLVQGFFILIFWIAAVHYSHLLEAVHYTFTGAFAQAAGAADPEWLLFLPSVHIYSIYSSYVFTVELNKFYEKEQARFLKNAYQEAEFDMPV